MTTVVIATLWDGARRLGTPRAVLMRFRSESGWSTLLSDAQKLALNTPGADVEITSAQLETLARALTPENGGVRPVVRTIQEAPLRRRPAAGRTFR